MRIARRSGTTAAGCQQHIGLRFGCVGPPCGIVTLSLSFGMSPDQADTITIDPTMIDRIWRDFAFYRASGR